MKNTKLKLNELKIKSFITVDKMNEKSWIKGGVSINCQGVNNANAIQGVVVTDPTFTIDFPCGYNM